MAESDDEIPITIIRRDWQLDSWVYVGLGAHSPQIPFPARTEAQLVVSYLKTKANGRLRVQVDLK